MTNPFLEISQKLDSVLSRLELIESKTAPAPTRIPLKDFCDQYDISRPTVYAWSDKKLITLEKIGGRQYVLSDSITVAKKYQRETV